MHTRLLPLLCILIQYSAAFEFIAASITPSPTTIGTLATYQATLFRQIYPNVSTTPYDTQAVPPSATITLTFPA